MERAAQFAGEVWRRLPPDQQLLAAGAGFLAFGFALLFWTPLGNRQAARYCFGLAVLCHLLLWGAAKQFGWEPGPASSAQADRPAIDIVLDAGDDTERPAERADAARDPLTAAILDPRDLSARLEAPRLPVRTQDDAPLAVEPQAIPVAKAPELPKTAAEPPAPKAPPLAQPTATKEEIVPPAPAPPIEPPPAVRKEESKEAPPVAPTPRFREDRLVVAPDDKDAEFRVPKLNAAKTDPLEFSRKPAELANSAKKDELDFAPTAPPEDRPEPPKQAKTSGDGGAASEIERMARRDLPLATAPTAPAATAIPIPKAAPATKVQPTAGTSAKLEPARGASTIDADLVGAMTPAPAPADAAPTGGASQAGPTAAKRLGPSGDLGGRRSGDRRGELLRRFGGNSATEEAVALALVWLAAHQDPAGKWDCDGFMSRCPEGDQCEGKAVESGSDVGVTAIALLAFLGAGHTHRGDTRYRETVRKGLSWLLTEQGADGHLMGREKLGRIYSHAMATLALTEAYQMTADERLKPYCQKAVDWLVAAQERELGGWRYSPNIDSDTSVFGWAVMALGSARQAGLRVPDSCWARAQTWLPKVSSGPYGGLACYQPGRAPSPAMTAEALVCRQLFGLSRDSDTAAEAAIYLLERAPTPREPNIYYWYYGTVAMFQVGGPRWERWNDALQPAILQTQRRSGHQTGSWDPGVPWGVDGGRVFSTAAHALCLEVYYRHLPIYKDPSDAR